MSLNKTFKLTSLLISSIICFACSTTSANTQKPTDNSNKSGNSIPNAIPLIKSNPVNFKIPCSGGIYIGSFNFTKDPEEIKIKAVAKSLSGEQVCTGGSWVDSSGKFISVASIGCPEGANLAEASLDFVYSPGNGGNNQKTVYLEIKYADDKPNDCKTAEVNLSI